MVEDLLADMEHLSEIVVNSNEMKELFHSRGISQKYMSTISIKSTVPLIQKIFRSEIAAQACGVILRN